MTKTKKILTAIAVVFALIGVGLLGNAVLNTRDNDVPVCHFAFPDHADTVYTDHFAIYSGQIGEEVPALSDSEWWVLRFTVSKIVSSTIPDKELLVKQYKQEGAKPLTEGRYLLSVDVTPGEETQRIVRADRVTADEAAEINTKYDAVELLGDNHAFAYPLEEDKGKS